MLWSTAMFAQQIPPAERVIYSMTIKPYQKGDLNYSEFREIQGEAKIIVKPSATYLSIYAYSTDGKRIIDYFGTVMMSKLIEQNNGLNTYLISSQSRKEGPYINWQVQYSGNKLWLVKEILSNSTTTTYQ